MATIVLAATGLGLGLGVGLNSCGSSAKKIASPTEALIQPQDPAGGRLRVGDHLDEGVPIVQFCDALHSVLIVEGTSSEAEAQRKKSWLVAMEYATGTRVADVRTVLDSIEANDLSLSAEARDRLFFYFEGNCPKPAPS